MLIQLYMWSSSVERYQVHLDCASDITVFEGILTLENLDVDYVVGV